MIRVVNCPLCGSSILRDFIKTHDKHYGVKGEFTTTKCVDCGLVFMNPMPDDIELSKFYPASDYYSYYFDINQKENVYKNLFLEFICVNFPTHDAYFSNSGRVLDIGCGNGRDLVKYRNDGWEVAGVEPSEIACKIGNEYHLNLFHGNLIDAKYPSNNFDYIRMNHAFEHIYNPNEYLLEIYRILKPDGKLFIGVPNIDSLNFKVFKSNWYYFGLPVHTYNYSMTTLCSILIKHNFTIVEKYYNSTWGGILGSMQIVLNNKSGKPSHQGFIVNFKPLKVLAGFIAKFFNLLNRGDCIEVIAIKSRQ